MSTWTTWRVVAVAVIILASGALAIFAAKNSLADNPGCIAGLTEVANAAATPSATGESGITTNLFVVTDRGSAPQLVRTLSVQAPVDSPQGAAIRGLLGASPATLRSELGKNFESQNEYRDTLLDIIGPKTGKPQAFPSSVAKDLLKEVGVLPMVVVTDGIAKVTIVLPADRFLTNYFSGDAAGDTIAQPWKASSNGRDITLGVQSLGTGTAWHVGFCVDGMQILSAHPQPDKTDGDGLLNWNFPENRSTASSVEVTLRPDYQTALRLWVLNRTGRTAALSWVYISPILVLAIGLFLVPRTPMAVFSARPRLASLTFAACLLAGAGILALLTATWSQQGGETAGAVAFGVISYSAVSLAALRSRGRQETGSYSVGERLAPALPLIAAVAWAVAYARAQNLGAEHLGEAIPRTLAASGYAAFFTSAVLTWMAGSNRVIGSTLRVALIANVIIGLVLCTPVWSNLAILVPIWITANFAFGFALFLVSLLPKLIWRRIPTSLRIPVWFFATSLTVVAVVAQWLWATYQSQSIWWRAPLESDPACFLAGLRDHLAHQPIRAESACAFPIELAAGFYQSLSNLLMGYPLTFLAAATSLLPLLGLAGLLGVLYGAARSTRLPVWGKANQWIGRVIAFLFLIFVVGYGGEAFGFRLPLALLIAVGLLMLALSDRITRALAWITEHNAGGPIERNTGMQKNQPLILTFRRELLSRAKDLAALEQQRSDAFSTYEKDSDAYYKMLSELDAKSGHLRNGGDGLLLLPEGFGPGELALALGPAARWWTRGTTAVHQGMRIAWLPIAYFLYVLLLGQGQSLVRSPVPLSLVGIGAAVVNEVVFWLTAAFTFGCLFPFLRGRNGLIKGLVLGGVYFGAHAGASLFGVAGDTLWPVRSFQLLLYLVLLGIMLDATTVEGESLSWQYLLGRYKVHEAQTAVSYALSFITLLTIVGKQLVSNEAANAITTVVAAQEQVSNIVNAISPLLPPTG